MITAENMAAESVPMNTNGIPYVHPNIRTFLTKIRICRFYIHIRPSKIRMRRGVIRIFPPYIRGRGRTAADTREEVIAAENMAAKSVPMNIHITPRIWFRGQGLESKV